MKVAFLWPVKTRGGELRRGLAALATAILVSIPADAQTTEERSEQGRVLEEIIVTASKRGTGLRDIAGSVGAVGGEQLDSMKAQGLEDYLKLVPGVTLAQTGVDQSVPIIRGVATTSTTGGFTALFVGIYLDDMPFQDLFAPLSVPNLHPFDLERVEVLKGPQGTLFGSGALSGAIRYIPRDATLGEWETKLQYTTSNTKEGGSGSTIAGAVNVPLGEHAAIRVLSLKRKAGGLYDVRAEDHLGRVVRDERNVDRSEQESYRIMARWDIGERLGLSALYFEQESTQDDAFSYADQRKRPERTTGPFPSPRESSFGGLNVGATYAFDWVDVLYSGNKLEKETFSNLQQSAALGLGNQDFLEAPNTVNGEVDGTTHELRFSSPSDSGSRWTWLLGASRLNYNQFIFQFFTVKERDGRPPPRNPEDVSFFEKVTSQLFATIDSKAVENAVFGEVTRLFGQRWELTAGLRKYKTELKSDTVLSGGQIIALTGETENRNSFDIDSKGLTPKFALRFLFREHIQFYALAAKGFQFGGVQLNPPTDLFVASAEESGFRFGPYDSSTLWNYEIGVRSEWFDQRLRADLSLFYLDWTDLQLTVTVPVTEETLLTPAVGFGLIANVGSAHSQGAELSVDALPWPWLRLTSSVSYLEAETDEPFDEDHDDGPVPAGTPLPGAPQWQLSNVLSFNFGLPFTDNWDTTLNLTHTFMDKASDRIRKEMTVGDYHTYDFRAIVSRSSGRLLPSLPLGITNFTDERAVSANASGLALTALSFIQPRTVSLSLDVSF